MHFEINSDVPAKQLRVDDAEILRYLGYRGQEISERLWQDIKHCKQAVLKNAVPRVVSRHFTLESVEEGMQLSGTSLTLTGSDIKRLLKRSEECVLMAATIGIEVERTIRYHQKKSVSDGMIMDAVATAVIEAVCDAAEDSLRRRHPITRRFSCGYGDLPIGLQPKILEVLDTRRAIGLFCNESGIMIPRKSVTAIVGICEQDGEQPQGACKQCSFNHDGRCMSRKCMSIEHL